ncbi:MAG: JAB domain-containing protein [Ignavibacteria bacterium]|nr:JAB domain-containing protein [Ignavibacteria bacterium]
MKVKDLPIDDRPREKLELYGAQNLSDVDLIAILIRSGMKNKSAVSLAREIIKEAGDLKSIMKMSQDELHSKFKGIGKTKAITLMAAFEIAKRIAKSDLKEKQIKIESPKDVFDIFNQELSHLDVEKFYLLILNSSNYVKKKIEISSGTLNASLISPREIFKPAIDSKAANIILVHNHPSGNVEPSREDINVTKQIVEAGKILEIPVLDHIIIANNQFTSFVERKLL